MRALRPSPCERGCGCGGVCVTGVTCVTCNFQGRGWKGIFLPLQTRPRKKNSELGGVEWCSENASHASHASQRQPAAVWPPPPSRRVVWGLPGRRWRGNWSARSSRIAQRRRWGRASGETVSVGLRCACGIGAQIDFSLGERSARAYQAQKYIIYTWATARPVNGANLRRN